MQIFRERMAPFRHDDNAETEGSLDEEASTKTVVK